MGVLLFIPFSMPQNPTACILKKGQEAFVRVKMTGRPKIVTTEGLGVGSQGWGCDSFLKVPTAGPAAGSAPLQHLLVSYLVFLSGRRVPDPSCWWLSPPRSLWLLGGKDLPLPRRESQQDVLQAGPLSPFVAE